MLSVAEIWRYPVKSLGGERLDEVPVDRLGIAADRAWGLYDPGTGMVLTARREPALLFLSARLDGDRPVVTCDDGSVLADDAAISTWLGRPVELRSAADGPGTFENPIDVEHETDWIQWQSIGGTFHDGGSKISLVSTDSLGEWDRRRFRINLVLDGSGEDDLTGDVRVGSATLTIRKPIERCVMVTRAQPGIPKDVSVLRRIIRERDNRMGVGAVITSAGTIHVGDELGPG